MDGYNFTRLKRRELSRTETDDIAMARAAMAGFKRPDAAIGMARTL